MLLVLLFENKKRKQKKRKSAYSKIKAEDLGLLLFFAYKKEHPHPSVLVKCPATSEIELDRVRIYIVEKEAPFVTTLFSRALFKNRNKQGFHCFFIFTMYSKECKEKIFAAARRTDP